MTPPAKKVTCQMNNMRGQLVDVPERPVKKRTVSVDSTEVTVSAGGKGK